MAFWDKNKNTVQKENTDIENEVRNKEARIAQLKEQYEEKAKEIENIDGVVVYSNESEKNPKYKLYFENDMLILRRFIDTYKWYSIQDDENKIVEILNEEPLYFKRDHYEIVRENNNTDFSQQPISKEAILEKCYPISGVSFVIKDKDDPVKSIEVSINTIDQNLSFIAELLKQLSLKNFYNVIDIPQESFKISVLNGANCIDNSSYQVFRQNGELIFCRSVTFNKKVYIAKISIADILYYKVTGELRYEQQISGGGGMGINYGGAVVGSLLLGGAGAVIGSRKNEEIQKIESKTITHDSRLLELAVRINENIYTLAFDMATELAFDWLIPEKQYDYVIQKRRVFYENN